MRIPDADVFKAGIGRRLAASLGMGCRRVRETVQLEIAMKTEEDIRDLPVERGDEGLCSWLPSLGD